MNSQWTGQNGPALGPNATGHPFATAHAGAPASGSPPHIGLHHTVQQPPQQHQHQQQQQQQQLQEDHQQLQQMQEMTNQQLLHHHHLQMQMQQQFQQQQLQQQQLAQQNEAQKQHLQQQRALHVRQDAIRRHNAMREHANFLCINNPEEVIIPENMILRIMATESPTGFFNFYKTSVLQSQNPIDRNPPCNTLYVGNLPGEVDEEELKLLFSHLYGYRNMAFRISPIRGPLCFVEFVDEDTAAQMLNRLFGVCLHNSKPFGIRVSFAKNPLGVRSRPPRPRAFPALAGPNPPTNNGGGMSNGGARHADGAATMLASNSAGPQVLANSTAGSVAGVAVTMMASNSAGPVLTAPGGWNTNIAAPVTPIGGHGLASLELLNHGLASLQLGNHGVAPAPAFGNGAIGTIGAIGAIGAIGGPAGSNGHAHLPAPQPVMPVSSALLHSHEPPMPVWPTAPWNDVSHNGAGY